MEDAYVHQCEQCAAPLHTAVLCDEVWMPRFGEHFCNRACVKAFSDAKPADEIPIIKRPVGSPGAPPGARQSPRLADRAASMDGVVGALDGARRLPTSLAFETVGATTAAGNGSEGQKTRPVDTPRTHTLPPPEVGWKYEPQIILADGAPAGPNGILTAVNAARELPAVAIVPCTVAATQSAQEETGGESPSEPPSDEEPDPSEPPNDTEPDVQAITAPVAAPYNPLRINCTVHLQRVNTQRKHELYSSGKSTLLASHTCSSSCPSC